MVRYPICNSVIFSINMLKSHNPSLARSCSHCQPKHDTDGDDPTLFAWNVELFQKGILPLGGLISCISIQYG